MLLGIDSKYGSHGLAHVHKLAMIDASGLHPIPSPPDPTMERVAWGGGNALVFSSSRSGRRHIYLLPIGGTARRISPRRGAQDYPAVSPDGRWLTYEQFDPAASSDRGLRIIALDGGPVRRVTTHRERYTTVTDIEPDFSPDGHWITFARATTTGSAVFVVRTDGSHLRRLTSFRMAAIDPRWSPDGSRILFTRNVFDNGMLTAVGRLMTVPVSGGPAVALTRNHSGWAFEADWSPDGTAVIYKFWEPGWDHNQLRMTDADGSADHAIWTGRKATAETPDWVAGL